MLKITGLKKRFGSNEVLKGIDVTVNDGEIVGFVGSSGAGKSTFLRCINFLETPDEGHIQFDAISFDVNRAQKSDIQYMRQNTTMVFQQFNLFKEKTALENVMLGLIKVHKKSKEEAKRIAMTFLEQVGLADKRDHYPSQLSGGQQQRVALARAVVLDPKIILLDEPTSALDPEMVGEVLTVIKKIAQTGKTMLIVSHEMNFIYQTCDKVIFMDGGVIAEQGTPREVLVETHEERTKQFLSRVRVFGESEISKQAAGISKITKRGEA